MRLLTGLFAEDAAAVRKVYQDWPKGPPNRDPGQLQKEPSRVGVNSLRDLRCWITLLRIVEGPDAAELKTALDRLGANPTPVAVAELAKKVRLATRRRLAEVYSAADPARQALVGWAVDPDDVPAYPQSGRTGSPNPEHADRRGAEKAFHEWLAAHRYTADATLLGASDPPTVRDAANGYLEVARAYADAFR
jgi:hypothetical protein